MKLNKNIISVIAFAICVLLVVGSYFIFYPSNKNVEVQQVVQDPFSIDNYNLMKTDTFIQLVKKKYGESAVVKKPSGVVTVNITGANMKTQDFFNGNKNLLDFDLKEHGFEIKHAKNSNSINATFALMEGGVKVPNDVLINLAR